MATDTTAVRKNERVNTPPWKFRIDPELKDEGIRAAQAAGTSLGSLLVLATQAIVVDARAFIIACQKIIRGDKP